MDWLDQYEADIAAMIPDELTSRDDLIHAMLVFLPRSIRSHRRRFPAVPDDYWLDEGVSAVLRCADKYTPDKGPLENFAKFAISRGMLSACRKHMKGVDFVDADFLAYFPDETEEFPESEVQHAAEFMRSDADSIRDCQLAWATRSRSPNTA